MRSGSFLATAALTTFGRLEQSALQRVLSGSSGYLLVAAPAAVSIHTNTHGPSFPNTWTRYQIFTRSFGARYSFSPGFTLNAGYH